MKFFFRPTLNQNYSEILVIENIYDHSNNQIVSVKATVATHRNFYLVPIDLDFGTCALGEISEIQKVKVMNTSKKRREYTFMAATHG